MTVAEGKGRVAAGNQVMLFVVTPVNFHVVLVAADQLVPGPGRLRVD